MDGVNADHATRFGFEAVSSSEKTERVQAVFDDVASRYDVMNDLMSLGWHRIWKHRFIQRLNLASNITLLDVAGGTGDVALGCYAWLQRQHRLTPQTRLIVCDPNISMLHRGQARAWDRGILDMLEWRVEDACTLSSVPDQSVDLYTIVFGLRNVTHLAQALTQARRVLKPDGRFYALELGRMDTSVGGRIYRSYLLKAIPRMGRWVTGHEEAYRYLAESIVSFPPPQVIQTLLVQAGFRCVNHGSWTGGVVHWHYAWGEGS